MIRPRIRETIAALERAVAERGPGLDGIDRILLVGGSSRIPLVAEMVREATHRPIALDAHPKHTMALGAAWVAQRSRQPEAAGAAETALAAGAGLAVAGAGLAGAGAASRFGGGRRHGRTTGGRGRPGSDGVGRRGSGCVGQRHRSGGRLHRVPGRRRSDHGRCGWTGTCRGSAGRRRERARPLGAHRGWSSPPSPGSPSWSSPRGPSRSCRAARAAGRRPARARSVPVGHLSRWRPCSRSPSASTSASVAPSVSPSIAASPTPAPTPTPTPAGKQARINSIAVSGGRYVVDYEVFGYTQKLPGMHVHFFFDTVPPTKAGMPAKGPWYVYAGPIPFKGYKVYGSAGQGDPDVHPRRQPRSLGHPEDRELRRPPELTRDRGVSIERGDLVGQIRRIADEASRIAADDDLRGEIETVIRRLDEPLRVAIAGRTKAGKSTLLNALVGERLAATDASECTRIVTWYRHALGYRVDAELRPAGTQALAFRREDGALLIDLGELAEATVERIEVGWPLAGWPSSR